MSESLQIAVANDEPELRDYFLDTLPLLDIKCFPLPRAVDNWSSNALLALPS